jgi:hypothetical protein
LDARAFAADLRRADGRNNRRGVVNVNRLARSFAGKREISRIGKRIARRNAEKVGPSASV